MPITWDTASDWDSAASESGVVHESVTNTDHDDAGTVKRGYSAANPSPSTNLVGYWPFHEDSGSTAYDQSGNGNDGSISGATVGQSALLGTTGYSFDGSDDMVDVSSITVTKSSDYAFSVWFYPRDTSGRNRIMTAYSGGSDRHVYQIYSGDLINNIYTGSWTTDNTASTSFSSTGAWHHLAVSWDSANSTLTAWLDNSQISNGGTNGGTGSGNDNVTWGNRGSADQGFYGYLWDARWYSGQLNSSDVQQLYDVVNTDGTLTTDWRAP